MPTKPVVFKPMKPMKLGNVPGFKAASGRPQSNVGKYLIKPIDGSRSKTGFEMIKDDPTAVEQAKDKYLKKYQLPPALAPKYLREPEIQRMARGKAISKGWIKPRSRQG